MTSKHPSPAIATATIHTLPTRDGATLSYRSVGAGPAVLVIPGALSVAADYASFAGALAAHHYTVHTIERRGRGLSSPQGAKYGMDQERADVGVLLEQTGASFLVGHSFGGLVALEAARNNPALTKIAVYEPGVSIAGSIAMDWIPTYTKKLAEKKDFDALIAFSLGTGPERARNTPHWLMKLLLPLFINAPERQVMLGLLPENLREHQEVARLDSSYENYREIAAAVLLMYGGKSHTRWVDLAMEQLATVLPRAETREFPALNHFGIDKTAPREVAQVVGAYFAR